MGETISSRLRQLLVQQMDTYEADEDVNMDEETKTKLGKLPERRLSRTKVPLKQDLVGSQTVRQSFLPCSEHCVVSHLDEPKHDFRTDTISTDINRIHPVDSQGVQNIQSSTTGHYVLDEHETKARARIMVINNSHDRGNGGYVGLMNAVFAAQKRVSLYLTARSDSDLDAE